jgi:hypothetical protein
LILVVVAVVVVTNHLVERVNLHASQPVHTRHWVGLHIASSLYIDKPKIGSVGWVGETKTYMIYCTVIVLVLYICTTASEGVLGMFSGLGMLSTLVSC